MKKAFLLLSALLLVFVGCSTATEIHIPEIAGEIDGKEVHIIELPPMTVASVTAPLNAPNSKMQLKNTVEMFVNDNMLDRERHFIFNTESKYEYWVTIPDDMQVYEPFEMKEYPGGLYAMIKMVPDENNTWRDFIEWVNAHDDYEIESDREYLTEEFEDSAWVYLYIPIH